MEKYEEGLASFVTNCMVCQQVKVGRRRPRALSQEIDCLCGYGR